MTASGTTFTVADVPREQVKLNGVRGTPSDFPDAAREEAEPKGYTRRNRAVKEQASRRGILSGLLVIAALQLGGVACGGPALIFPGGALSGVVVAPPESWEGTDARFLDLELRAGDPYSVQLNYVVQDGKLYIDPAEGRRWFDYLREDARVRVRLSGKIYELVAVLVGRPGELSGFDTDRFVYRLDPRSSRSGRR